MTGEEILLVRLEQRQRYTCHSTHNIYDPGEPDGLHAFGGGPLSGDQWVRVLYLDESGIGKLKHEPHLVVAGVLVDGDRQWVPLKEHLRTLLQEAVPSGQPTPKSLHAVDIYHGWGEFPKTHWPEPLRYELLDNLAKVPQQFRVPVVWGMVDRVQYAKEHPNDTPRQHLIYCYASATMLCFYQLAWYMRNAAKKDEVAAITMEQNSDLQKRVKEVFRAASSPEIVAELDRKYGGLAGLVDTSNVVDEPSFQEKSAASVLQLADFCAWAIKRSASQQQNHERFMRHLAPATLIWRPGQTPPIHGPFWVGSSAPRSRANSKKRLNCSGLSGFGLGLCGIAL